MKVKHQIDFINNYVDYFIYLIKNKKIITKNRFVL